MTGRFDEALTHERAIHHDSYQRQRDKVHEDGALAEMEPHDLRNDELDFEAVLAFAEHVRTIRH